MYLFEVPLEVNQEIVSFHSLVSLFSSKICEREMVLV